MKKKNLFGILLGLACMLGLMLAMSATAYAGEVYVGDTNVSNGGEFCNGAVKYDANTKTLTLKNYTYEGSGMGYCGINVDWNTKFTVVLEGVNTVKCTAEDGYGINNTGWLVFKGNGTLNISGQDNGIESESGKVVIESGTVNATSTGTDDSPHAGIRCNMEFEMSGGTVNAKANCPDNGYTNVGIWTDRSSKISGGQLTAAGSSSAIYGAVYNSIAGVGWTDMAGTTGKTVIPINTEGQFLDSYKKVQLPEVKAATKPKAKKVTSVTVNVKTVNAKAVKNAVKKAGGKDANITTITLGSKVAKINANTFKGFKKAKTLVVKTKKLKKASVKNSLKGSKVTKIKVNVGSKSANKKFVKNYKKIFTKKNAGKAVKVA